MKKNTLQKTVALALTGAMAMTALTGCGGSEEAANTTTDTKTETAAADTKTDAPAADTKAEEAPKAETEAEAAPAVAGIEGWEPFAENVTLQIPVYDRGDSGNGCSDVENNYWTNWVQENFGNKYNVTVEYVGITRSDVMTDYSLLAAAQDLPTICAEYDYDKLATWQADGYLQPYDIETFKQVAPTYWANMEANGLTGYTQLGGDDYLLLGQRPYGNTNYAFVTWYREDWLKEAGFTEYPQTQTELNELYLKLIENGHQ
ncbi:MAG: extracellular solute-binding protein [Lachnospiraceae bacterium]|nr:extracellular solute-binding protein [Lachnospiraceae bacterium]